MSWYADRAHASSSGDAAQSQGMVDEVDRGGAAVAHRTDLDDLHLPGIGFRTGRPERDQDS